MGGDLVQATGACQPKKATLCVFTKLLVGNAPPGILDSIDVKVDGEVQSSGELGVAVFENLEAGKSYPVEADLGKLADKYGWCDSPDRVLKATSKPKEGYNGLDCDAKPLPSLKVTVYQMAKDPSTKKPQAAVDVVATRTGGGDTTVTSAADTGLAEFKALPTGTYKIATKLTADQEKQFVAPRPYENVPFPLGAAKTGDFTLVLKGTLRVEVARYDKKPLSKPAKVKLKEAKSGKTLPVQDTAPGTDANTGDPLGALELKLAAGKYEVTVTTQDQEIDWKIAPKKGENLRVEIKEGETTSLRATLTPYKKVQFIGFEAVPGTASSKLYLGDKDAKTDIDARCAIMKDAIRTAKGMGGKIDSAESTLKVFMAPEFFFRGADGGYPVEKISSIVDEKISESVAAEIVGDDYKHWLFVLGTAIGYLPHEQTDDDGDPKWWGKKAVHSVGPMRSVPLKILDRIRIGTQMKVRVAALPGTFENRGTAKWHLRQTAPMEASQPVIGTETDSNNYFWLCLKDPDNFEVGADVIMEISNEPMTVAGIGTFNLDGKEVTLLWVVAPICKHLLSDTKSIRWKVRQKHRPFDLENSIIAGAVETRNGLKDEYMLLLDGKADYQLGKPIEFIEPIAAEVFNVALVRRGGPDPNPPPPGLRRAIVFKEYVSWVDYLGKNYADDKFGSEKGREILIYGKTRTVLPTAGSRDTLGSSPQDVNKSEINKSGEGGGSVFTMDGITFGMEVCLDHLMQRLRKFYSGASKPDDQKPSVCAQLGDPIPQVYLIPSWGMTIGGGPTYAVPEAPIFNVDGRGTHPAVATLHANHDRCEDHDAQAAGGYPFACPEPGCDLFLLGTAIKEKGFRTTVTAANQEKYFKRQGELVVFESVPIPDGRNLE